MNNLSFKYENASQRLTGRLKGVYKMTKAEKKLIKAYIEFLSTVKKIKK